jgi:hypothetical protein
MTLGAIKASRRRFLSLLSAAPVGAKIAADEAIATLSGRRMIGALGFYWPF